MRVVLDTDVLVAALRSPAGASAEVVRLVLRNDITVVVSVALILEYEAVATRSEHLSASGLSASAVLNVIDALARAGERTRSYFLWRPQLRDPNDEMVLEAAVNAGSVPIVTFNHRDFFEGSKRFRLPLLLPGDLLRRMRQ